MSVKNKKSVPSPAKKKDTPNKSSNVIISKNNDKAEKNVLELPIDNQSGFNQAVAPQEEEETAKKIPQDIDTILKRLRTECKFADLMMFRDVEESQIATIDYNEKDPFKQLEFFQISNAKSIVRTMIWDCVDDGTFSKELVKTPKEITKCVNAIVEALPAVKRDFARDKPQMYKSKRIPTFNLFKSTPAIEYKPDTKFSMEQLLAKIKKDYPRFDIWLRNSIREGEELEWFLNWVSMDMNESDKILTTLILVGEQGSGKSALMEGLMRGNYYHESNVIVIDNNLLRDKFNDIYYGRAFVIMNEITTMDLKDNNQIAQDLKRLITDGTYIQRGMYKSGKEKRTTFNICFLTNSDAPLPIEHGDRRYAIFGRAKSILKNKEQIDFTNKYDDGKYEKFFENFQREIKQVVFDIKSLDYDSTVGIKPLLTPIKKEIIHSTNTKEALIKSCFNTSDYKDVIDLIKGFDFDDNQNEFLYRFERMLEEGIFLNDYLNKVYKAIFKIDDTVITKRSIDQKSGAFWNKLLIKPHNSEQIKIDGKVYNYKVLSEDNLDYKREKLRELLKEPIVVHETINDKVSLETRADAEQRLEKHIFSLKSMLDDKETPGMVLYEKARAFTDYNLLDTRFANFTAKARVYWQRTEKQGDNYVFMVEATNEYIADYYDVINADNSENELF